MPLFTIGYEGMSPDQFANILKKNKIDLLIDVRELPISRKRGFAKTALSQLLAGVGIDYGHIKALGCPKNIRDRFKTDGDWVSYKRSYKEHLKAQSDPLKELVNLSTERSCVLLCFEADYAQCHRSLVANAVRKSTEAEIIHLSA